MSIFKFFKKKEPDNKDSFGEERIVDIEPYAPHQNLEPVPYRDPKAMEDLKLSFADHVSEFLNRTDPDQFNSTYVDNIVDCAKNQSMRELDSQRAEHVRTIERSITSIWKGDRHYYETLIQKYDEELPKRENELRNWKKLRSKGTAFEEFID